MRRYYAFELCAASMNQLFLPEGHEKKYERPSNMPSPKEVLLQLTEGLLHIHSQNVAHRDIKPANILISFTAGGKVTMKWADFDRSKPVNEAGEFSLSVTGVGTPCWIAPEILNRKRGASLIGASDSSGNSLMISFKSDIWSTGCVFFYYVTGGKHPFGDLEVPKTIQDNMDLIKYDPINILGGLKLTYGISLKCDVNLNLIQCRVLPHAGICKISQPGGRHGKKMPGGSSHVGGRC